MADDYELWLGRAKSSLAISKNRIDENVYLEDLCFQAQQAAEKALKGLLVFYGAEPEKTHNLVSLIKELSKYAAIPEEIKEAAILNDYAVQTRYPGGYTPIEEDEYGNAVKIADNCIKWAEKVIKKLLGKIASEDKNQPYFDNL